MSLNITPGKRVLSFDINVPNLRGHKFSRAAAGIIYGPGLEQAAKVVRDLALNIIWQQFNETRGAKYKERRTKGLEQQLFPDGGFSYPGTRANPPIIMNGQTASFDLFPNMNYIKKNYPYLEYQEAGSRANIHRQAFRKVMIDNQSGEKFIKDKTTGKMRRYKLMNIKDEAAIEMEQDSKTKRFIRRIPVHHPAFLGRFFIKSGVGFINNEGKKVALLEIRKQIDKALQ